MASSVLLFLSLLALGAQAVTVNIVWFCPQEPIFRPTFSADNTIGSIQFALNKILADPTLLPSITGYEVRYRDSACNSQLSYGGLTDLLQDGFHPDLIIGPLCTGAMTPVAAQASILNIPVFGWISSDPPLKDKTVYTTLVRLLMPLEKLSSGVVLLLNEFGWKKAELMSSGGGDYGVLAETIREAVSQQEELSIINWIRDVAEKADSTTLKKNFAQAKLESRIIIFVCDLAELRAWVIAAFDEGLSEAGEYILIYINQRIPDEDFVNSLTSDAFFKVAEGEAEDGRDEDVKTMMKSLMMLFTRMNDYSVVNTYLNAFRSAGVAGTLDTTLGLSTKESDFYSLFMYDAMMMYAKFATLAGNFRDGAAIRKLAENTVSQDGATGDIIFDEAADREPDFWMFGFMPNDTFALVAETITTRSQGQTTRTWSYFTEPRWPDEAVGKENAPQDEPSCGFDNEKCPDLVLYIVPAVVTLVVIIAIIVGFFVYRKVKYESDLKSMAWKIDYNELAIYTGVHGPGSVMNLRSMSVQLRSKSKGSIADSLAGKQLFITVASYKGTMVAVKNISKIRIKFERELLQEMRTMISLKHPNLNTFIGAVTDAPHISTSWEYATKGSLQDVIYAENIALDDMFKFSICIDILKGLAYLQDSPFKFHGRLKSTNIVIDGRWVCKLTDFGLREFCEGEDEDPEMSNHAKYESLFWRAPETLREHYSDLDGEVRIRLKCGSQQGDIYSVGVIFKEIFCRNGPYTEHEDLDPKDILTKIIKPEVGSPVFRPSLSEFGEGLQEESVKEALKKFISSLWSEEPADRPVARDALKKMIKINPFKNANVMDNMVAMMEKYSNQLEEVVAERTQQLEEERKKTEALLLKMLPKSVADSLKIGKQVEAEAFECVTMYFSDIPGFSDYAANSTPHQVVDFLNAIYSLMDEQIGLHDVYKVETVGDVYVTVSGLPMRNGDRHIVEIMNCALDLLSAMMSFVTPHKPSIKMHLRMGVHTGPIVAGVIGLAMPRYCLFGDTINTTSRMESTGKLSRIHMSPKAKEALCKFEGYKLAERGEIAVKGKGNMVTYWLLGHKDFDKQLPDWNVSFKDEKPAPKFLPPTTGKSVVPRGGRPSMESGYDEPIDDPTTDDLKPIDTQGQGQIEAPKDIEAQQETMEAESDKNEGQGHTEGQTESQVEGEGQEKNPVTILVEEESDSGKGQTVGVEQEKKIEELPPVDSQA